MPVPGTNGDVYVPFEEREGGESVVFFTRDLSPEGLKKAYDRVKEVITGQNVAIKLHTGEPNGPNIIPSSWIKEFMAAEAPDATIIETNTAYEGGRYTTEQHRETLKVNGWTDFTEVDITDDNDDYAYLPVDGKWFDKMSVGAHMVNYDSLITLTHFKGHPQGGFGGSNKNIGIGCASGHEGKVWIHSMEGKEIWSALEEEIMEKITESTAATLGHFGDKVCFVNVMRNMSVDCDCFGVDAAPVVTPNVGILASLDICAIDTACVDMVWAMKEEDNHDLKERIQSRKGLRQLTYMQEMGMGNMKYKLIDMDNNDAEITAADAVAHVVPFEG